MGGRGRSRLQGTVMSERGSREGVGLADLGLGLMAIAAGSSDALAYLKLGNVFTSAMTGNTVLLCIAVGQGRLGVALQSFTAFAAFATGVVLAAALSRRSSSPARLLPLFMLEIACLMAFVALWLATGVGSEPARYALISLSAIAMGVQGVTARNINVPQVNTIVFTTTIVSVVAACTHAVLRATGLPFDTRRQIGVLLVYAAGAVLTALLVTLDYGIYVFIPLVAVTGALLSHQVARRP
jgi:uncharacterized membrane protein YoaK (UPF0700 family)